MAIEFATIDQWIYETLTGDVTLQGLLATGNLPPNYQTGVYAMVAPQVDVVSRKPPLCPYIVFAPVSQEVDYVLCGSRDTATSTYRITVWDTQDGTVSYTRAQQILARVETLLDKQKVVATVPNLFCVRQSLDQTFDLQDGGHVDIAVSATFVITSWE